MVTRILSVSCEFRIIRQRSPLHTGQAASFQSPPIGGVAISHDLEEIQDNFSWQAQQRGALQSDKRKTCLVVGCV